MHATINAFCLITLSLLYCKIYTVVRRHKNQIHALGVQVAEKRDMANAARLRKTAVSTFYVYAVFLACYVSVYFLSFSSFIGDLTAVPFDMWYYVFTLICTSIHLLTLSDLQLEDKRHSSSCCGHSSKRLA